MSRLTIMLLLMVALLSVGCEELTRLDPKLQQGYRQERTSSSPVEVGYRREIQLNDRPSVANQTRPEPRPHRRPVLDFQPTVLAGDEELWVLVQRQIPKRTNRAGSGSALFTAAGETRRLWPKRTRLRSRVHLSLAQTRLQQEFVNPFDKRTNVRYRLALPGDSTVREFTLTYGSRKIRGIVTERKDAEALIREARDQGLPTALLTQRSDGTFEQELSQLAPRQAFAIGLTWFTPLSFVDGRYRLRLPLAQRDAVTAVRQRKRSDVQLRVDVDLGLPLAVTSPSHEILQVKKGLGHYSVGLAAAADLRNEDFWLDLRPMNAKPQALWSEDPHTLALLLQPGRDRATGQGLDVLVLPLYERSFDSLFFDQTLGKIQAALTGKDRLALPFGEAGADQWHRASNLRKRAAAMSPWQSLNRKALEALLQAPSKPKRRRVIFVLGSTRPSGSTVLQDGLLPESIPVFWCARSGRKTEIPAELLQAIKKRRGAVLPGGESIGQSELHRVIDRLRRPQWTDLKIRASQVMNWSPAICPDLYAGRPVLLLARKTGSVKGLSSSASQQKSIPIARVTSLRDSFFSDLYERRQWRKALWAGSSRARLNALAADSGLLLPNMSILTIDCKR